MPITLLVGLASITGTLWQPGRLFAGLVRDRSEAIRNCQVTDGDTLRCDDERIRLLGIDAPEMPGHCRPGRECAPGDPYASTDSLQGATQYEMQIARVGEDRYGRTLATVTGSNGDLSCWQLRQGQAIYKPRWDNGGRVAHACPDAAVAP